MHTYIQQFIAQILLFSGLLQSCHSPHVVDVLEEAAAASVEVADSHDTDANPYTRKRKITSAELIPDMSSEADQEPSASHPATTLSKVLRLSDAGQEPQETVSPTSLDQAGDPARASASIQPEICTGTDSFDELLLESDVFVDKSLFIKEFLERKGKVSLITRPRRWGKSLNMDMLKRFLTIEVDDEGKPLPQAQSLNRKLFIGGEVVIGPKTGKVKQLFPLKIAQQCPDLISDYQGEYPVISIGFKDAKGSSYQAIEAGIRGRIIELYRQYGYLEPYFQALGTTVGDTQREQLCRYLGGGFSEEELKSSLRFLSELLHKYFGKEVYILIDEYDAPINEAYVECKDKPEEFSKVVKLFQYLLGATLKSNPFYQTLLVDVLHFIVGDRQ
ncbi:MAG: AAA family ATPase, partial [Bacteroidota bacterium]